MRAALRETCRAIRAGCRALHELLISVKFLCAHEKEISCLFDLASHFGRKKRRKVIRSHPKHHICRSNTVAKFLPKVPLKAHRAIFSLSFGNNSLIDHRRWWSECQRAATERTGRRTLATIPRQQQAHDHLASKHRASGSGNARPYPRRSAPTPAFL